VNYSTNILHLQS